MVISATCIVVLLAMLAYQAFVAAGGIASPPGWLSVGGFLSVAAMAVLLVNYRHLMVTITSDSVTVRFGRLKHQVQWKDVARCRMNEAEALAHTGRGISIRRGQGRWGLAFAVENYPLVSLELRRGFFKELAFSTNNPERVKTIAARFAGNTPR
jgi:hypothetical protein